MEETILFYQSYFVYLVKPGKKIFFYAIKVEESILSYQLNFIYLVEPKYPKIIFRFI